MTRTMTSSNTNDPAQPIAAMQAERSLIGAILQDGEKFDEAAELLQPDDFFDSECSRAWVLFEELSAKSIPLSMPTVAQYIIDNRRPANLAYLMELHDMSMRGLAIERWVQEVREKSMLRRTAKLCERYGMDIQADDIEGTAGDVIGELDQQLLNIAAEQKPSASLAEQCQQTYAEIYAQWQGEKIGTRPTGIADLDQFTGGIGIGEVFVLAGRPGMGKSAAVVQSIYENCSAGVAFHLFSPEMTSEQVLRRLAAIVAGIPAHKLRSPDFLSAVEVRRLNEALNDTVAKWPLKIDDTPGLTITQVLARARVEKRKNDTQVIALDYLQKLKFLGKAEHRYQQVTDAAVALTGFAKTNKIATLLLSSLTTKNGKDRNMPPQLSDLRSSGDIEYEAHTGVLIHRKYEEGSEKLQQETTFIVAKARNGDTGMVSGWFSRETLLFERGRSR